MDKTILLNLETYAELTFDEINRLTMLLVSLQRLKHNEALQSKKDEIDSLCSQILKMKAGKGVKP